jgi:hypothetical protein
VRAVVRDAGLRTREFAAITGWHEQRVWRLMAGRMVMSTRDAQILARLAGKTINVSSVSGIPDSIATDPPARNHQTSAQVRRYRSRAARAGAAG